MANLAIRGHNLGWKVIKTLEMLGGVNQFHLEGNTDSWYVLEGGVIRYCEMLLEEKGFTLEEFLEKFPFKIGDRVRVPEYESEVCISKMYWDGSEVQYEVVTDEVEWYSAKELLEWNALDLVEKHYAKQCDDMGKTVLKTLFMLGHTLVPNKMDEKLEYEMIDGYEFDRVDNNKIILKPIKSKYPKTYEECYDILGRSFTDDYIEGHKWELIMNFQKLLVCRDAYWKLAGEQMGLGKPWEPNWDDENEFKYGLYHFRNGIMYDGSCINPTLLAFPTAEMRDVFYENFKDLIEQCKELL